VSVKLLALRSFGHSSQKIIEWEGIMSPASKGLAEERGTQFVDQIGTNPKNVPNIVKAFIASVLAFFVLPTPAFAQSCGDGLCPGQCVPYLLSLIPEVCTKRGIECAVIPDGYSYPITGLKDYSPFDGGPFLADYVIIDVATGSGSTVCGDYYPGIMQPPPVNSQNSPHLCSNSSINIDRMSLNETIPIVGVPFTLNYSSDRMQIGFPSFQAKYYLGGWVPSVLHQYDFTAHVAYFGDGSVNPTQGVYQSGGYYVASQDASEIYYFDGYGNPLQTKDALTGATKFTFSYDNRLRLTAIVDQFGSQTTFSYLGNQVLLTSPYGQVTTLLLDSNALLSQVKNPNNEIYGMTYIKNNYTYGLLQTFTLPGGQRSQVTYDSNGFVSKDQGAGGDSLNFTRAWNPSSGILNVTSKTALGRTTAYTATPTSNGSTHKTVRSSGETVTASQPNQGAGSIVDSVGVTQTVNLVADPRFGWNAPYSSQSGYAIANSNVDMQATTKISAVLSNSSDPLSLTSLTKTTIMQNDSTRTFSSTYQASTRQLTLKSPLNRTITEALNSNAMLSVIQNDSLTPILFSYNSRGNPTSAVQGARKLTLTYDTHGNLLTDTDFLGRTTSFSYDNAGRILQATLPDKNVIAVTYNKNGAVTSLTPGKTAHTFYYNLFELLQSYLPPSLSSELSGATTYFYNLDQQLTEISRPDGSKVLFNYNASNGNLSSISTPTGAYTLSYAPNTSLISSIVSPDNETVSYSYAGALLTKAVSGGVLKNTVSFAYNPDGSLASTSVSGSAGAASVTNFSYDKDGLVTGAGAEVLTKNSVGLVSSSKLGGILKNISYDSFGLVTSDNFYVGTKLIFGEAFSRDLLGRIAASGSEPFQYDSVGRLIVAGGNQYFYDSNGNRIKAVVDGVTSTATYDAQDRLQTYGALAFAYNANGDLTEKRDHSTNQTTKYAYDVFGNLKTVTLPGKTIQYVIDGQNRRIAKKVNDVLVQGYIYQSQTQIAAVTNGTGALVAAFVYGEKPNIPDYMIQSGITYRIISDQVGTPKMVVDPTGRIVETLTFDEFGVLRSMMGTSLLPFGFAGGLLDTDTGLVRFGARDYDPATGRWTTKDPILFAGASPNLYQYVLSDPLNNIDPNGMGFWGSVGNTLGNPKQPGCFTDGCIGTYLSYIICDITKLCPSFWEPLHKPKPTPTPSPTPSPSPIPTCNPSVQCCEGGVGPNDFADGPIPLSSGPQPALPQVPPVDPWGAEPPIPLSLPQLALP
jgi:RHS repeat-associated protein